MEELLYITARYLVYRNIVDYGFIKFSVFKKIISYVTGVDDVYTIRKIFIKLLDEGFFKKTKNIKRSYLYKFIGYPRQSYPMYQVSDPLPRALGSVEVQPQSFSQSPKI